MDEEVWVLQESEKEQPEAQERGSLALGSKEAMSLDMEGSWPQVLS